MATGRGCGCSQGCGCAVVPDDEGLFYWTGNGSPGSPFKLGMSSTGGLGCEAVVGCVAEAMDPGLAYNNVTGKLNVKLSGDAGNTLTIAADGGLMGTGGVASSCAKTIAALPAFAFGGDKGGSGLIKAFSCRGAVDYAAAKQLDVVEVDVQATADQVACPIRFVDEINLFNVTDLNTDPAWTIRDLRVHEWEGARVAHGTATDPYPYNRSPGWPKPSGWYGYLEAEEYQWSLPAWLAAADQRFVTIVNVLTTVNPAFHVDAAIKAVQEQCAQESAFIQVEWLDTVPQITAAGITPMARVMRASGDTPTLTAAQLTAAGVQWATVDYRLSNTVFQTYLSAGIKVFARTGSRHVQTSRFLALPGMAGVVCGDPVYARGVLGPAQRAQYFRQNSAWELRRRNQGMLESFSDRYAYFANGYYTANYAEDVLHRNRNSVDAGIHDGLLPGFCMPIDPAWLPPPLEGYTLEVYARPESPMGPAGSFGWYFCASDDRHLGHSALNNAPSTYYAALYQPVTGAAEILKVSPGSNPVQIASGLAGTTSVDGAWTLLRVSVTTTQVKFTCVPQNGTASAVLTANDTDFRGNYALLAHNQQGGQYDIGWRDLDTFEGAI